MLRNNTAEMRGQSVHQSMGNLPSDKNPFVYKVNQQQQGHNPKYSQISHQPNDVQVSLPDVRKPNSAIRKNLWVRSKNDVNYETIYHSLKKDRELGDGNNPDVGLKYTRRLYKVRYNDSGSPLRRSYVGEQEEFVAVQKKKETQDLLKSQLTSLFANLRKEMAMEKEFGIKRKNKTKKINKTNLASAKMNQSNIKNIIQMSPQDLNITTFLPKISNRKVQKSPSFYGVDQKMNQTITQSSVDQNVEGSVRQDSVESMLSNYRVVAKPITSFEQIKDAQTAQKIKEPHCFDYQQTGQYQTMTSVIDKKSTNDLQSKGSKPSSRFTVRKSAMSINVRKNQAKNQRYVVQTPMDRNQSLEIKKNVRKSRNQRIDVQLGGTAEF